MGAAGPGDGEPAAVAVEIVQAEPADVRAGQGVDRDERDGELASFAYLYTISPSTLLVK